MENVTGGEASTIDEQTFTVTRSISIAAPIEKVWRAITEPEHISRWFGQTVFDGAGRGAQGTMTFDGHGTVPIRIEQIDAPRAVTYRWCNDNALDSPQVVHLSGTVSPPPPPCERADLVSGEESRAGHGLPIRP